MLKSFVGSFAILMAAFAVPAFSTAQKQADCCCGSACVCVDCACAELGCACDVGGPCVCDAACCASGACCDGHVAASPTSCCAK